MSEEQAGSTGKTTGSTQTSESGTGGGNQQTETVAKTDYDAVSHDMHKYKGQVKERRTALDAANARIKELETKGLEENENYKDLWEKEKTAHSETMQKKQNLETGLYNSERRRALEPELKKLGFRDDASALLDKVDLDGIDVELTTGGRILCSGQEQFAQEMKKTFGFAFQEKSIGNVNGGGGDGTPEPPGDLTPQDVAAKEREYKAGKCSYDDYKKTHAAYRSQQAQKRKQA